MAAYATELVDDGKSMSTVRLAVAAIVDAHRRVSLDSPVTVGVSETLCGLARQIGVSQKQAKPLEADSLAAIKATAFMPRRSRGGSIEIVWRRVSIRRRYTAEYAAIRSMRRITDWRLKWPGC